MALFEVEVLRQERAFFEIEAKSEAEAIKKVEEAGYLLEPDSQEIVDVLSVTAEEMFDDEAWDSGEYDPDDTY